MSKGSVKNKPTEIRVVDFFSGCGGSSAGFKSAGMKILAGIDIDADAAATFRHNFSEASFVCRDIRKITATELDNIIPNDRDFPLLFCACAPCQPFSAQNKKQDKEDDRVPLLGQLHRFIRRFKPDFIFIENVPGIQKLRNNGPFPEFLKLLAALNYSYVFDVVRAEDFGVPQRRARLVLIASKRGAIELPKPSHGPKAKRKYSRVWDWISYLPPIKAGTEHPRIKNHRAADISDINLKRLKNTPQGGDRRDWPKSLILKCHEKYSGHTDVYGRMKKNGLAPALTTKCTSISNGRFGHPTQTRAISIREAARIQTFPKSFLFTGNSNSMARQIGNAVPVLFAKKVGIALTRHLLKQTKTL